MSDEEVAAANQAPKPAAENPVKEAVAKAPEEPAKKAAPAEAPKPAKENPVKAALAKAAPAKAAWTHSSNFQFPRKFGNYMKLQ